MLTKEIFTALQNSFDGVVHITLSFLAKSFFAIIVVVAVIHFIPLGLV